MEFDNNRIKNMSTVEVSLIGSNPKLEPDAERYILRPQRPPPPPPTQAQPPAPRTEQSIIPPECIKIQIYVYQLSISVSYVFSCS